MATRRIHPVGGRVVLMTGAAGGIGAEAARRLAARGARMALLDIDVDGLEQVARDCPGSVWQHADVSDDAALRDAVQTVVDTLGGIDVAIANAGIARPGLVGTAPPADFERTLEVNLLGACRTFDAALPHVLARRGYLLGIASVAALAHVPGIAAYSASKAGLEAFCNALRLEVGGRGVGVGVAYFSWIDTAMVRDSAGDRIVAGLPAPFDRISSVQDAARSIVRGVERRERRVTHPGWVGALLPLRGLLQPLVDREGGRLARAAVAAGRTTTPR